MNKENLTFAQLRKASLSRLDIFGHTWNELPGDDWSPAEWTNAMAGEAGEACNLTKKLLRDGNIAAIDIGFELADVVMYADLAAARLGLDLEDLIRKKFNIVSNRIGSPTKL